MPLIHQPLAYRGIEHKRAKSFKLMKTSRRIIAPRLQELILPFSTGHRRLSKRLKMAYPNLEQHATINRPAENFLNGRRRGGKTSVDAHSGLAIWSEVRRLEI
jgi:hypothetical protein